MEYDNTNKGSIWKNDKKLTDNHPDFKGSINVDGKDYWLSAWYGNKTNPKAPALRFAVQKKESISAQEKHVQDKGNAFVQDTENVLNDSVPF